MIIVTGNRRSGTSLWMQILEAGGFKIFGDKFPAHWKKIEAANKNGFYESQLVQGINYHTNPSPESGHWFAPTQVKDYGVKVFSDGLVKTDFAYIDKVIATIRNWQESETSQQRLDQIIKNQNNAADDINVNATKLILPIGYNWWNANFELLRDMMTRRYPCAMFSYEALLKNPDIIISNVFKWLGTGHIDKAVSVVESSLRTQQKITLPHINHDHAGIFDELYHKLDKSEQITPIFYKKLLDTNSKIKDEIAQLSSRT
ncbi:MAG: hypothetical protein ACI9LM_004071 [Alteromonadaceae bacterium]|jgi:hypothetical protein